MLFDYPLEVHWISCQTSHDFILVGSFHNDRGVLVVEEFSVASVSAHRYGYSQAVLSNLYLGDVCPTSGKWEVGKDAVAFNQGVSLDCMGCVPGVTSGPSSL